MEKGEAEPKRLSQYDLAELRFRTLTKEPASFDHLDGKTTSGGLVRSLFEWLLGAAKADTRVSHRLVPHNYQRLLNKIDNGVDDYSPPEYLRAIHNPSYRDVVQKTIVKHPSDWYHKKEDSIWQAFLKPLKRQAPDWEEYSEAFIEKMAWMQEVTAERLGPVLWHMHPVMFLGSLLCARSDIINFRQYEGYIQFRRNLLSLYDHGDHVSKPYVPDGDKSSGVTIGYGYDLGRHIAFRI